MAKEIKVKVKRFDPSIDRDPYIQEYVVPFEDGMSVANVLCWISDNLDPTLAFYISCRIGKCEACLLKVNGKGKLACTELVTGDIELEPIGKTRVIKDLVRAPNVGVPVVKLDR
ncbi:Fumarate reductase iron-sulfur subunit [subsurface metagenome]